MNFNFNKFFKKNNLNLIYVGLIILIIYLIYIYYKKFNTCENFKVLEDAFKYGHDGDLTIGARNLNLNKWTPKINTDNKEANLKANWKNMLADICVSANETSYPHVTRKDMDDWNGQDAHKDFGKNVKIRDAIINEMPEDQVPSDEEWKTAEENKFDHLNAEGKKVSPDEIWSNACVMKGPYLPPKKELTRGLTSGDYNKTPYPEGRHWWNWKCRCPLKYGITCDELIPKIQDELGIIPDHAYKEFMEHLEDRDGWFTSWDHGLIQWTGKIDWLRDVYGTTGRGMGYPADGSPNYYERIKKYAKRPGGSEDCGDECIDDGKKFDGWVGCPDEFGDVLRRRRSEKDGKPSLSELDFEEVGSKGARFTDGYETDTHPLSKCGLNWYHDIFMGYKKNTGDYDNDITSLYLLSEKLPNDVREKCGNYFRNRGNESWDGLDSTLQKIGEENVAAFRAGCDIGQDSTSVEVSKGKWVDEDAPPVYQGVCKMVFPDGAQKYIDTYSEIDPPNVTDTNSTPNIINSMFNAMDNIDSIKSGPPLPTETAMVDNLMASIQQKQADIGESLKEQIEKPIEIVTKVLEKKKNTTAKLVKKMKTQDKSIQDSKASNLVPIDVKAIIRKNTVKHMQNISANSNNAARNSGELRKQIDNRQQEREDSGEGSGNKDDEETNMMPAVFEEAEKKMDAGVAAIKKSIENIQKNKKASNKLLNIYT
jgi:hypothetical protein